jgi:hypothetical protein
MTSSPTIFVSGPSADLHRVRAAMWAARKVGFALIHDWAADIHAEGSANDVPEDRARVYADSDIAHAVGADVMWVLIGGHHSVGANVELGARLHARGRDRIVLSGPLSPPSIFYAGIRHAPIDLLAVPILSEFRRQIQEAA